MRNTFLSLVGIAIVVGGFFLFTRHSAPEQKAPVADYKNTTYVIEGESVTPVDGKAESETAPGGASKTVTQFFGNVGKGDANLDGITDLAVILTQSGGGSATFYYVVVALQTADGGYEGTNGILLGDRIAPQTTEIRDGKIIVNYADRAEGEPMTTEPSVAVSKYLKVESGTLIEIKKPTPSASGIRGVALLGPTCPVMRDPPDPQCADKPYKTSNLVVTIIDGSKTVTSLSTDANGMFSVNLPAGEYKIRSMNAPGLTYPFCQSAGTITVPADNFVDVTISCDTGIR